MTMPTTHRRPDTLWLVSELSIAQIDDETMLQSLCIQDNFTSKVEYIVQLLVCAERFEAVGPLCRLAIPIYEQQRNFKVHIL